MPDGGGAVWRCGLLGDEVVAALSCDRLCCGRQDGWSPRAGAGAASRLYHRTAWPDATPDIARSEAAVHMAASGATAGRARTSARTADVRSGRRRHFEPAVKTSMAPLRGWGRKGKRLRGFAPHGHWRTLAFLGALRCDRLTASASSTVRSMADASAPMSSNNSFRSSNQATSSLWTATRGHRDCGSAWR